MTAPLILRSIKPSSVYLSPYWLKFELESTRGPLQRPKISLTLVHKWLKIGPEFFTHPQHSVPSPVTHALSSIYYFTHDTVGGYM